MNNILFLFIVIKLFLQYANKINVNDKFLLLIINYAKRKVKGFAEAYYAISIISQNRNSRQEPFLVFYSGTK